VVYSKPPFNGPENVLGYLGRYTHRIAITNHRIIGIEDGKISFRWKDYADGNTQKVMALDLPSSSGGSSSTSFLTGYATSGS
jgi:hypothetical protein